MFVVVVVHSMLVVRDCWRHVKYISKKTHQLLQLHHRGQVEHFNELKSCSNCAESIIIAGAYNKTANIKQHPNRLVLILRRYVRGWSTTTPKLNAFIYKCRNMWIFTRLSHYSQLSMYSGPAQELKYASLERKLLQMQNPSYQVLQANFTEHINS